MENIVKKLEYFNFSNSEANIYIALLKYGELNGSQISKILGCSRSVVYDALKTMEEKGVIIFVEGATKLYKAKSPENLMEEIKQKSILNAEKLKKELSEINSIEEKEEYWNIKGEENYLIKIKEMLEKAEKEVYINTNVPIDKVEETLKNITKKGVRVVLFSFSKNLYEKYEYLETYFNDVKNPCSDYRMMLVVDNKITLVVNKSVDLETYVGTYTENPLMVKIISEHIHHDIYISKVEKKYGKNLIDESIMINSDFENKIRRVCCNETK